MSFIQIEDNKRNKESFDSISEFQRAQHSLLLGNRLFASRIKGDKDSRLNKNKGK